MLVTFQMICFWQFSILKLAAKAFYVLHRNAVPEKGSYQCLQESDHCLDPNFNLTSSD